MSGRATHTVFAGSYRSADAEGLHVLTYDPASMALVPRHAHAGVVNPSFLLPHPNGSHLYAVSETGAAGDGRAGQIWSFRVDAASWRITPLNRRESEGDYPCHLAIDRTGRWLVVSNYGSGSAALFPIRADGSLGEVRQRVQHSGSGPNRARQAEPHVHSATFTPNNRFLILADLGIDQLVVYNFDAQIGALATHAAVTTAPEAGPRHSAFHPHGRLLAVVNELNCTVTVYAVAPAVGALVATQTLPTVPEAADESSGADVHFSADGRRLYVSNRGHNSIAIFDVHQSGRLRLSGTFSCGGDWPRNFAVSPDGRALLVANRRSNALSVLKLTADGAAVAAVAGRIAIHQPACVRFAV